MQSASQDKAKAVEQATANANALHEAAIDQIQSKQIDQLSDKVDEIMSKLHQMEDKSSKNSTV